MLFSPEHSTQVQLYCLIEEVLPDIKALPDSAKLHISTTLAELFRNLFPSYQQKPHTHVIIVSQFINFQTLELIHFIVSQKLDTDITVYYTEKCVFLPSGYTLARFVHVAPEKLGGQLAAAIQKGPATTEQTTQALS